MANPTTATQSHTRGTHGTPSPPGPALPSPLPLDGRIGRLLQLAQSATGASTVAFLFHSPEEGRIALLAGNPPITVATAPLASALPLLSWAATKGPLGTAWAQAEGLPQSQALPQEFLRQMQEFTPHHLLPLLLQGQPLGGLLLGPTENRLPHAVEALEQLARSLADAASSLEDARLYAVKVAEAAELRRRLEDQQERATLAGQRLLDASATLQAAGGQALDGRLPDEGSGPGMGEALRERVAPLERLASEMVPELSWLPDEERTLSRTSQSPSPAHGTTSPEVVIISASSEVTERVALCLRVRWPACTVKAASGVKAGLSLLKHGSGDLVFLDAPSREPDLLHLCQEVRQATSAPLILLSASSQEAAESQALEAGADAYLSKPFSYRLLLAKAQALLRRSPQQPSTAFAFPGLSLDLARREATVRGRIVRLTATEARLLQHLMTSSHDRILPAQELLTKVWGREYANATYLLKVHIQHLRRKLEEDPRKPHIILTQRGQGYRLAPPVEGQVTPPSAAAQPLLFPLDA